MSDELRSSTKPPPPANFLSAAFGQRTLTLPAAAFTASVLFDVLSLIGTNPEQTRSYRRGAADLLLLGLSSALASLGLEIADYLGAPPDSVPSNATQTFALNGAVIATYLLDVAAREKYRGDGTTDPVLDATPIGLSLLGLTLLGISGRLR